MRLKNRLVMAPMGTIGLIENDGLLSQRAIEYYEERTRGGVGLIITGGTYASSKNDPAWIDDRYFPLPRADTPAAIVRLNQLAEIAHDYDCRLCLQLTPGLGRVAGPAYVRSGMPVGPSAVSYFWNPSTTVRPLSKEEVVDLVKSFGPAAEMGQRAGVDAIELHGHAGYLLDQFMTPLWNKRTDKYGGATIKELMTFPLEIIETINKATGGSLPIIFRFALTHQIEGGRTEEEGLEICHILENAGIAALDVDAGCYENSYVFHPTTYQPPAPVLEMAAKAKREVKIPVICVGKMHYPDIAVKALEDGKADFVMLGRGLLADPEWPDKTRSGRIDEIRPCIGCHEACLGRKRRQSISCAVNPACGDERALRIVPAEQKRIVIIVGGGPAGMEAARVSRLRGHDVTLYEKSGELGGQLIPASVPDFKYDLILLRKYYENEIKRLGIRLFLNTEGTAERILRSKPDVVFLATGGAPSVPQVLGINDPKVTTAIDILKSKAATGENVIVIGGGMVGCELAVYLAQKGKKVTVIEMLPRILNDMDHVHANREMLLKMLEDNNVTILTNLTLNAITESGIRAVDSNLGIHELPADSLVTATGSVCHDNLYDTLRDKVEEIYRLGDCFKPGRVLDAVWDAYGKARHV